VGCTKSNFFCHTDPSVDGCRSVILIRIVSLLQQAGAELHLQCHPERSRRITM